MPRAQTPAYVLRQYHLFVYAMASRPFRRRAWSPGAHRHAQWFYAMLSHILRRSEAAARQSGHLPPRRPRYPAAAAAYAIRHLSAALGTPVHRPIPNIDTRPFTSPPFLLKQTEAASERRRPSESSAG